MKYIHFDVSAAPRWQELEPSCPDVAYAAQEKYRRYLETGYQPFSGEELPMSNEELEMLDGARSFVASETGIYPNCPVRRFSVLERNLDGVYDTEAKEIGFVRYESGTTYGDQIRLGSILVHELTHGTVAQSQTTVLDLQDNELHTIYRPYPHEICRVTPGYRADSFFEEALGEEVARRWREEFDPLLKDRDDELLGVDGLPPMPVAMYTPAYPIDQTTFDFERGYVYSAFCTYGVRLLSERTGVDLMELLIAARHAEKQRSAAQKLKFVVDSVEPGLCEILMSADDSLRDSTDALAIVKQAIAASGNN